MGELDIRKFINEATEGLINDQPDRLESLEVDQIIIPRLVSAVVGAANEEEKPKLAEVEELVQGRSIGIATYSVAHKPEQKEGITLHKDRINGRSELYTLRFVVNPTVAYSLRSADDLDKSLSQMKTLMLEAYGLWKQLSQSRQFVPVYETWS